MTINELKETCITWDQQGYGACEVHFEAEGEAYPVEKAEIGGMDRGQLVDTPDGDGYPVIVLSTDED